MHRYKNLRGVIDPITIIGVLFLIVTLGFGAYTVRNREISLNISEKAGACSCGTAPTGACLPCNSDDYNPQSGSCTCGVRPNGQCKSCAAEDTGLDESDCECGLNSSGTACKRNCPTETPVITQTNTTGCYISSTQQLSDGAKVVGGVDGVDGTSSGYAKCVGGKWVDCPECTILTLTIVPTHLQDERAQAENLAQLEATELEVSRISCDQSGGTWNGSDCLTVETTTHANIRSDGSTAIVSTVLINDSGEALESEISSIPTIQNITTNVLPNRGGSYGQELIEHIVATNNYGDLVTQSFQSLSSQPVPNYPIYNFAFCNEEGATVGEVNECNQNMSQIYSTPLIGNYIQNYAPQNVEYTWQENGYDSYLDCLAETQGEDVFNKCYKPTDEQYASSIYLGSAITGAAAATVATGGILTGIGQAATSVSLATGTIAINSATLAAGASTISSSFAIGMAGATVLQTGSAVSTCILNSESDECENERNWAIVSWLNIGSSAIANALQTGAAQTVNTITNSLNIVADAVDINQSCGTGQYSSSFGCGAAWAGALFDVGQGGSDLIRALSNSHLGGLDNVEINGQLPGLHEAWSNGALLPPSSQNVPVGSNNLTEALVGPNLTNPINTTGLAINANNNVSQLTSSSPDSTLINHLNQAGNNILDIFLPQASINSIIPTSLDTGNIASSTNYSSLYEIFPSLQNVVYDPHASLGINEILQPIQKWEIPFPAGLEPPTNIVDRSLMNETLILSLDQTIKSVPKAPTVRSRPKPGMLLTIRDSLLQSIDLIDTPKVNLPFKIGDNIGRDGILIHDIGVSQNNVLSIDDVQGGQITISSNGQSVMYGVNQEIKLSENTSLYWNGDVSNPAFEIDIKDVLNPIQTLLTGSTVKINGKLPSNQNTFFRPGDEVTTFPKIDIGEDVVPKKFNIPPKTINGYQIHYSVIINGKNIVTPLADVNIFPTNNGKAYFLDFGIIDGDGTFHLLSNRPKQLTTIVDGIARQIDIDTPSLHVNNSNFQIKTSSIALGILNQIDFSKGAYTFRQGIVNWLSEKISEPIQKRLSDLLDNTIGKIGLGGSSSLNPIVDNNLKIKIGIEHQVTFFSGVNQNNISRNHGELTFNKDNRTIIYTDTSTNGTYYRNDPNENFVKINSGESIDVTPDTEIRLANGQPFKIVIQDNNINLIGSGESNRGLVNIYNEGGSNKNFVLTFIKDDLGWFPSLRSNFDNSTPQASAMIGDFKRFSSREDVYSKDDLINEYMKSYGQPQYVFNTEKAATKIYSFQNRILKVKNLGEFQSVFDRSVSDLRRNNVEVIIYDNLYEFIDKVGDGHLGVLGTMTPKIFNNGKRTATVSIASPELLREIFKIRGTEISLDTAKMITLQKIGHEGGHALDWTSGPELDDAWLTEMRQVNFNYLFYNHIGAEGEAEYYKDFLDEFNSRYKNQ